MAKVKKDVERVTTETVTFTLTLSAEEAETLAAVMGTVGGDCELSARKHTDAVLRALEAAGVAWFRRTISRTLTGHVLFGARG
jgi:hypothetical protein